MATSKQFLATDQYLHLTIGIRLRKMHQLIKVDNDKDNDFWVKETFHTNPQDCFKNIHATKQELVTVLYEVAYIQIYPVTFLT